MEKPDATYKTPATDFVTLSDGARIGLQRWGTARPERMVVSHGNGLAVDGFREFGRKLADKYEVIAFDMRNHGHSGPGPLSEEPWPRFVADIPEIFDHIQRLYGDKPTHGAFHSLSSVSTLFSQALTPRDWRTLTLYEPPVPPIMNPVLLEEFLELHAKLAARTRNRRRRFKSPDELKASFLRSPTFAGIPDEALGRLAIGALFLADPGEAAPWQLVCDPEQEARTYEMRNIEPFCEAVGKVTSPVQVVIGGVGSHDMPILINSCTALAETFGFPIQQIEQGNHLLQLQWPGETAAIACDFAEACENDTRVQ